MAFSPDHDLGIVLQMKSMHIEKVVNFPFPTSPDRESLKQAEKVASLYAVDLHVASRASRRP